MHREASQHDWDEGLIKLFMITRSPKCWLSTALLVYWRGAPHFYRQYPTASAVDPLFRDTYALLQEIVKRVERNGYPVGDVPFDPTRVAGQDLTKDRYARLPRRRLLPEAMLIRITPARRIEPLRRRPQA